MENPIYPPKLKLHLGHALIYQYILFGSLNDYSKFGGIIQKDFIYDPEFQGQIILTPDILEALKLPKIDQIQTKSFMDLL